MIVINIYCRKAQRKDIYKMNDNYFENIFDFIKKFDYNNINDCKFFIQILYDILMNDDNNNYPDYIKDSIFELFYKIVSDESNMHIENKQNYCKQMNVENSINKINNNNNNDNNDNTEFLKVFSNRALVPLGTRQDD